MENRDQNTSERTATFWTATCLSAVPLLLGLVVLVGWYTENTTLIQVQPTFVPMQYNTALGFLLSGAALFTVIFNKDMAARWLGGLVGAIGVLTLFQYVTGMSLGIDQALMTHYITTETSHPGRMAPNTALCFSLTSLAVYLALRKQNSWLDVSIVGSLIFGLGLVPFTGYLIGLETAYGWAALTRMAVHTSFGFIFIGVAVLVYCWHRSAVINQVAPNWIPFPVSVALLTITICLWQALQVTEAVNIAQASVLVFGVFLSMAMGLVIWNAQRLSDSRLNLELRVEERTADLRDSEQRFRKILDSSSIGVVIRDSSDGTVVYANSRAIRFFETTEEEYIGSNHDMMQPEDADKLRRLMAESPVIEDVELQFKLPNGNLRWVLFSMSPLSYQGRDTQLCWLYDISARKEVEDIVAKSEQNLQQNLDNMTTAVTVSSHDGIVKYVNPKAATAFGLTREECIGKRSEDFYKNPAHRQQVLDLLKKDGFVKELELAHLDAQGNEIWNLFSVYPIEYQGDPALIATLYDITERRRLEEDLRAAKDAAEDGAKAKSAFLAAMSHEIRTPMNGVVGMVDLLTQTKLDSDQAQMLNTVRDSGHSLLTIINDILDFSKIEAGKLDIEQIDMALTDVVEGAAQTMAPNAVKKGVKMLTYIDPDIAQFKKGDPTRVRQIIINMGGNAIKFSEEGKEVMIRAERVGHSDGETARIRFSIIDQGIGISEEAQANLFQEFSQADTSTTRKFGGTGLGLAICKRLTELMGGEIGVDSVLGEGSTFWCELPFGASDKIREERKVSDLSGLRILVVSPHESYREICRAYLAHWNAEVEVTTDIGECLQRAQDDQDRGEPIDIIVVPDLDDHSQVAETRKAFIDVGLMPYPRFVIGEDPREKSDVLKDIEEVTMMDINPMRRAGMLTAVAIAAGRASPEVHHQEEIEVIQEGRTPTVEEALAQDKLILLAEDNLTNQLVIRKQLNTLGYQCEIANDGKEAFAMWQEKRYRMLLTDCHMPEWDGFELTDAVRKSEESTDKRSPIVAITANALQGEAERCIAAGMDDYMSKPVEMKILKQTLVKWMGDGGIAGGKGEDAAVVEVAPMPSSEQEAGNGGESPIDDRMLKDMFGDDDAMFKEILQSFIDPTEAIIADLQAAYDARSAADVKAQAHKLKSSSRSVGANELADTCLALETAGKEEDWETIESLAPKVEPLFLDVKSYVDAL